MKSISRVALILLLSAAASMAQNAGRSADFAKARDEAVGFLQSLIRIDTSNGNETRAAEYIKSVLDKEGIPAEIFTLESGHGVYLSHGSRRSRLQMILCILCGREKKSVTVTYRNNSVLPFALPSITCGNSKWPIVGPDFFSRPAPLR